MNINGKIPIRPHLKKFVLWLENKPMGAPATLSADSAAGLVFQSLLCQKGNVRTDYAIPESYSSMLEYQLTQRNIAEGRMFMSNWAVVKFNKFLHSLLHVILLERITTSVPLGKYEYEVINEFLSEVGIEDDISFDAIEKTSRRLRKRTRDIKFQRSIGRG